MNRSNARWCAPLVLALTALSLGACGDAEPPEEQVFEAPPVETQPPPALSSDELGSLQADRVRLALAWTNGTIRNQGMEGDTVRSLIALSASSESGFDRITADFDGRGTLIGYEVRPATGPVESCGGSPAEGGDQPWLNVRLSRLRASPAMVESLANSAGLGAIEEIRIVCVDEEAVEFSLLLSSAGGHRVVEVINPSALVIDVQR